MIVFVIIVILLFRPRTEGYRTSPTPEKGSVTTDLDEDYQVSKEAKQYDNLSDYYEKPFMDCPENYEKTMETMYKMEPKSQSYGYTGSKHRYIDDRFIEWSRLNEPMPVYGDFFIG
jgi:hypothetical protein